MSLREIYISLENIGIRRHNDFAIEAKLHGFKIPIKRKYNVEKSKFSEQDDSAATNAAMQRIKQHGTVNAKRGKRGRRNDNIRVRTR